MRTYSIKELENLSGTKAHTIRIWEQRYELLNPSRTETGIRFYSDDDLKKILATSVLLKNGFKISRIATLSKQEIQSNLSEIENNANLSDAKIELSITNILNAGLAFNENLLMEEFSKIESLFDTVTIFSNIVYNLLNRIGIMWSKDEMSPLQEHFISNIIRQKIISATNALPNNNYNTKQIVLFLPENETHEIGVLLANFLLKSQQINTIYFGQQVPISNLLEYINKFQIKYAFGFIFFSQGNKKQELLFSKINEKCSDVNFYWSGYIPNDKLVKSLPNHSIISSVDNINEIIKKIKND